MTSNTKEAISRAEPGHKILFVCARVRPAPRRDAGWKPETKESLSIDAAKRPAGTIERQEVEKRSLIPAAEHQERHSRLQVKQRVGPRIASTFTMSDLGHAMRKIRSTVAQSHCHTTCGTRAHAKIASVCTGLLWLTSFGTASNALAIPLAKYENSSSQERGELVAKVLKAYYHFYASKPETAYKAACMVELYKPAVAGGSPPLLTAILENIELARLNPQPTDTLEGVVEAVVNAKCKPP